MLLQRLTEYAERAEQEALLPPAYYRPKKIHWALRIEPDGSAGRLYDLRPSKGSKDKPVETDAPYAYRSGKTPPPCLMVDTAQYVLAVPKPAADGTVSDAAHTEAVRRHGEYTDLLLAWAKAAPDDPYAQVIRALVTGGGLTRVELPDGITSSDTVALMMSRDNTWLHQLPSELFPTCRVGGAVGLTDR